ncbi:MAG TPA: hypothetical protein VIH00_00225 [Candidatus Limnocylindrales bacterium]
MAWSASKIFMALIEDVLENTTAMDLNADTFKAALYDNDITPDQTVSSANSAYNAGQWTAAGNEVSDGTEWDAGGEPLTGVASTRASNVYTFDATDTPSGGSSATLAAVFGCLVYDDTIAAPVADQGVSYHYFGGSNSVTDGTFTIVWNASGIFTLTL